MFLLPALLSLALFAPLALVPSSEMSVGSSVACAPTAADYQLAKDADQVVKTAAGYKYRFDMETVQGAGHRDAFTTKTTPWTSTAVHGRKYRYEAELWVFHTISGGDCTGPDFYSWWAEGECDRLNVATGAIAEQNLCNFDMRGVMQVLSGSTWTTPQSWLRYYSESVPLCAGPSGAPIVVADGTFVRAVLWMKTRFYHHDGNQYTGGSQLSQGRWGSTQSVRPLAGLPSQPIVHDYADNDLYPGWYSRDIGPSYASSNDCPFEG
jgi:hypothetical protein